MKNFFIQNNCFIFAVDLKTKKMYKVEFYNNEIDMISKIKSVKEFDNFEDAKDYTILKINNHLGSVNLICSDND